MKNQIIFFLIFSTFGYSQTVSNYVDEAMEYWRTRNKTKEIEAWDNAIKTDTLNCAWLYYMRANSKSSYDKQGAIKDYLLALEANQNCVIEYGEGEWGEDTFLSSNYNEYEVYIGIGKVQVEIEDYSNAMINFNKVIKGKSKFIIWEALLERGKLKALLKDHRGAISDFDLVLVYNPKATIVYSLRGDSKFWIKDYTGAINDYTKRIQLYPNDSSLEFYNRGLARLALKLKDLGCKDLSKAGEQGISEAYEMIEKYCN
jgi:tetratricopeptide (TPR) repeat protein